MEKRSRRVVRLKFPLPLPSPLPVMIPHPLSLFLFPSPFLSPHHLFKDVPFWRNYGVRHKRFNNRRRRKRVYTGLEGKAVSFAPVTSNLHKVKTRYLLPCI